MSIVLNPLGAAPGAHIWTFFRAGGVNQATLATGADYKALAGLDQKLWVALSCPTRGLEFDSKTLDLIDTDRDGRIRAPEMISAVNWTLSLLKDPNELAKGGDVLALSAINDTHPEGAKVLAAAKRVLASLGRADANALTVEDAADTARIFSLTVFNGDGVVPQQAGQDPETKRVIGEILDTVGGKTDVSGATGIANEQLEIFFSALKAFSDWNMAATSAVMILGEATAASFDALEAVRSKVDDYFSRCKLVAFDARAAGHLNRAESEYAAIASDNLAVYGEDVIGLPLAHVEAGTALPLVTGINPAWAGLMESFRAQVVVPLLGSGQTALTESEWIALQSRYDAYRDWRGQKAGSVVEKLGLARVREILDGNSREMIVRLIEADAALAPEMAEIKTVEKLARYHRDLHVLVNNYVSFTDFYQRDKTAIFQVGRLYMDGRSCDLCIKIEDIGRHSSMANMGGIYLAYCQCTRPVTGEKMIIAAAFTAGDSDNLREGRNGIFYDRAGRDWDATVLKIMDHPISIRQAALLPYKRVARMIGEQIEKFAAARDKAQQDKMAKEIETGAKTIDAGKPVAAPVAAVAPPAQAGMQNMTGVFALLSVAVGSILGGIGVAMGAFLGLKWWQMPLAIAGVFLAISGPSMIIAWMKLRKRNLGPLLDASGWAINGRIKLNMALGRQLTQLAVLPAGAQVSLEDLYPEDSKARYWFVLIGVVIIGILILVLRSQ